MLIMSENFKKRFYFDNNATTAPSPYALHTIKKTLKYWGNPSSIHQNASQAKALLWEARETLSHFLNCHPLEIIFTSGASESNNQAITTWFQGLGLQALKTTQKSQRTELIISSVEHPSVFNQALFLEKQGFKVHKIPVSMDGFLDEDFLEDCLTEKTLLVSIMGANNETGVLFPLKKWIDKAHEKGALFHSDMVQLLGKQKLDLKSLDLDLASFSAHKFYSLQGCGLLFCKKGVPLKPFIHGGSQERGRRAGTENLTGITAFAELAKRGDFFLNKAQKIKSLRDSMEQRLLSSIKDIEVINSKAPRLDNTSCLFIKGVLGETLMMSLDLKGIAISVGSACSSGKTEANTTLMAMGLSFQEASNCVRISLGVENTKEEVDYLVKTLVSVVKRLRKLNF